MSVTIPAVMLHSVFAVVKSKADSPQTLHIQIFPLNLSNDLSKFKENTDVAKLSIEKGKHWSSSACAILSFPCFPFAVICDGANTSSFSWLTHLLPFTQASFFLPAKRIPLLGGSELQHPTSAFVGQQCHRGTSPEPHQ